MAAWPGLSLQGQGARSEKALETQREQAPLAPKTHIPMEGANTNSYLNKFGNEVKTATELVGMTEKASGQVGELLWAGSKTIGGWVGGQLC